MNGRVVVEDPSLLVEGSSVRIVREKSVSLARDKQVSPTSRSARVKPVIARQKAGKQAAKRGFISQLAFDGCPADMSVEHDHYASGKPKKVKSKAAITRKRKARRVP